MSARFTPEARLSAYRDQLFLFASVLVAGCGRLDFDPRGDGSVMPSDARTACLMSQALSAQSTTPVGNQPLTLSVADIDGDGRVDITTANEGDGTVTILIGDGSGNFSLGSALPAGTDPKTTLLADVDGDGSVDLLAAQGGGSFWVFHGDGSGTFGAHDYYATHPGTRWFALAPLVSGGGTANLFVECTGGAVVEMWTGPSPGLYSTETPEVVGNGPHGLVVADLDLDGNTDVATADSDDQTVTVLFGAGDGTFASPVKLIAGNYPGSLSSGDLNHDGIADLVVPNTTDGTISVFLGAGNRAFASQVVFPDPGGPNTAYVGDINGDGIPDVVTSNGGDSSSLGTDVIAVLQGNGDGTFQAPVTFATGTKPWGVVIADLNSDGKQDVEIVNEGLSTDTGPGTLGVFMNACP